MEVYHASPRIGWAGLRVMYFCVVAALLFGCAASPAQRIDQYACEYGFERRVITGSGFSHVVYFNDAFARNGIVHVYLEGDGTPWLHRYIVARDPTPRNPVMLHLMAMDKAPSLYLGRPCYHGLANRPACRSEYWTNGRYSPAVLESMEAALHRSIDPVKTTGLYFFGHSGGGALAMLLAERVPQTRGVVTLAGNLDTDAWTRYHGFSPLRASLNPARRAVLSRGIIQLHLIGGRDENIPPQLSYAALRAQTQAKTRFFPDFDHTCCWQRVWPEVLESLPGG
jgi:hypothetical protein